MLYVCATPIGNMGDITLRALETLAKADVILCEDTRISRQLFVHHNINLANKKIVSFHEHNEKRLTATVIGWLQAGLTIVQLSDAGTPAIADPGAYLCQQVRNAGFTVAPLPGCSAYVSLLSVSGVKSPSLFYGFLPSNKTKRRRLLNKWQNQEYAIIFYETPHRIIPCLEDIVNILGEHQPVIMGRELTKKFETIHASSAKELLAFLLNDVNQQKGEFVLILAPIIANSDTDESIFRNAKIIHDEYRDFYTKQDAMNVSMHHDCTLNNETSQITNQENMQYVITQEQNNILLLLAKELPPKSACSLCAKITGLNKDFLYKQLIRQQH